MTAVVVILTLMWTIWGVIFMLLLYRDGIREGIRREQASKEKEIEKT
jgi:hypothetical protein